MQDLSLSVLDLAQNSIRAQSTWVRIELGFAEDWLTVRISDDGCGMDEIQRAKALSPFYTTKRRGRGGMGLPLFRRACERTGGGVSLKSTPGKGTAVEGVLCTGHSGCPAFGNMGETMAALIALNSEIRFSLTMSREGRAFQFDTQQIKEELQGVPLSTPEIVIFLTQYIEEQIQIIRGGAIQNEKSC